MSVFLSIVLLLPHICHQRHLALRCEACEALVGTRWRLPPTAPPAASVRKEQGWERDSAQLTSPDTGARCRQVIHRPPLHPHHLSRLKTVLWFFFNGTQKLFFIKIYPGSHVLFIKLITETRWKKLMRSKCISNSLRFPRMGKCFLLYSLKVHHHLIKILRKGMRVAKLALKVDNLK